MSDSPAPVAIAGRRERPGIVTNEPDALIGEAAAEERDRHWFAHVYQDDHVPQLTLRAVLTGAALGMLMSTSNLYTTMKVGWSFGVAITACVLSFVVWNGLRTVSAGRLMPLSILENNCMQSTASAAGASTGSTIATAFGGLLILDPGHQHQPWWVVASFTLATGLLGVFIAIPMKRRMINHEALPFPSGIAAATTLRSLYGRGAEALRRAYALVAAMIVGAMVGILNTAEEQFVALGRFFAWMRSRVFDVHLPEQIPEHGFMPILGKPVVGFAFEPSVLLIGAGMIIGLRVSLSMLAASVLLHFGVAPWLAALDAASATEVGHLVSIPLVGGGAMFHAVRWSLWGGTAVMVFASLTALALQWPTIVRSFSILRRARRGDGAAATDAAIAAIEVPNAWLVAGIVPVGLALVAIQMIAFGIAWWAGVVAVLMSFVLSLVACRSTGETDTTPVGAMGKVMQLLFALISPPSAVGMHASVTHNLMAAGAGANAAAASADLLTDLKSGYLLGANPRKQFLAQFFGVFFGTLAIVPAWYLMVPDQAALEKYPLPATQTWVAVARVLSGGLESLPMSARWAILIGALIGVLIPIAEHAWPKARRFLPSAMGLGLGWVVFFSNALAFTLGALAALAWRRVHRPSEQDYGVPIASGLIAGESLLKAILAMLATAIGLVRSG